MGNTNKTVEFTGAELKKLSVKKLVSLDKEYEITIRTADQSIMLADIYPPDTTFKVILAPEND